MENYHQLGISSQQSITPQAYLRREKCPGCYNLSKKSNFFLSSSPPAETLSINQHGNFISGYDNKRVFFSYHRCGACSLLYCPTYFTQEQLNTLYKNQSENMEEVPEKARWLTQRAYFNILKKYHTHQGDYLEIGADIGLFAKFFAENNNTDRMYLYEPNHEVHHSLRQNIGNKKFEIFTKNFSKEDVRPNSLNTVSIIHTLDHMLEPRQLIRDIYQSLQPNGVVLIVTHDESSFLAKLLKRKWPPFTLQHPQLFQPKTIQSLLVSEKFKILACKKTPNYFPVTHFIKGGLEALGLNKIPIPSLSKWVVPIKLGNIITIAVKPNEHVSC